MEAPKGLAAKWTDNLSDYKAPIAELEKRTTGSSNNIYYLARTLEGRAQLSGCFTYKGEDGMTLIRMPFWERWNAACICFNLDWSLIRLRLVIGPKIR